MVSLKWMMEVLVESSPDLTDLTVIKEFLYFWGANLKISLYLHNENMSDLELNNRLFIRFFIHQIFTAELRRSQAFPLLQDKQ